MDWLKHAAPTAACMGLLALLLLCSAQALESARAGLALCARVIVPSLLPFFVLSALMSAMGIPARLGRSAAPAMSVLFGVSGSGAAAFLLGICGGYPLGAATVGALVRDGSVSREEGERLLAFCNNSGPAFILGAAGVGIFGSAEIGLKLYAAHVLSAAAVGVLFRRPGPRVPLPPSAAGSEPRFSAALPEAVRSAVSTVLTVCGFVVTFTVLTGVLDASGFFPARVGRTAVLTRQGLRFSRALLTGALELGSGIGALEGLSPTGGNLALCAFLIGWGGVSVHLQTAAVIAGTGMKTARHTAGRLLCGLFSAALMLLLYRV